MEDYEWRPTYLPLMRARVADKKRFMKDERRAMALNFAVAAAELDAPKKTLPALRDRCRLDAYARRRFVSSKRSETNRRSRWPTEPAGCSR